MQFTPKEINELKNDLSCAIEQTQQALDAPEIEGESRFRLEEKLITKVSAYNKLEHANPEKRTKNKEIRVLIIDDVNSMLQVHHQLLKTCGFRHIELASDGLKAYTKLRKAVADEQPFDLIISDWEMPRVSGLELLRKVRTDKELWHIPFFLITSLNDKPHILQAINAGATGYMVKPVNQKIVNKKFRAYLD